ncbi:uncharacterized protein LOC100575451 [Acyrthosiphon pisum]|uniref:Uncharacterized protein n=1 Tax=Acyrthosiphon pisum TaxID=7029 RepID=A0A8R2JR72_ACYPI|nr:uncharacterized protein LOC100575451 [Acyrthosiphon pisum]
MRDSWIRYNTNPTVITVQKDYRFWYLQFPSSTFCYVDPVDTEFAKDYVQRKWKVSSGEKFDYYMDFVKKVANITYENIDSIAPFVNNTELINVNIIDLVLKVLLNTYMLNLVLEPQYSALTIKISLFNQY